MIPGATLMVSCALDRDWRVVVSGSCSVVPVNEVEASILVDEAMNGVDIVTSMFSLMLILWEVCTDAIMTELSVEFVTRTFMLGFESPC